jgi:hypothetical protein
MQFEDELGDHAKVSSTTAYGPEEVGVLRVGCCEDFARSSDYSDLYEVVNDEAVLAGKPAEATSKNKSICYALE